MTVAARIGVVIVAYRSADWLERCLHSVLSDPYCHRCVLVDNDGSGDRFSTQPGVTYIRSPSNIGFGCGCNRGFLELQAQSAELDIFATINPDTWMEPGWGESMLSAFDAHAEFGILAPLQLTYDKSNALAPWTKAVIGDLGDNPPAVVPVEWPEGSAIFIRRDLWIKLDGFDPIFSLYYEEVDLCRRARRTGYRSGIVTAGRYHHASGGSFDDAQAPERSLLKDMGQALYLLTESRTSSIANHMSLMIFLLQRGRRWLTGKYPTFPQLCYKLPKLMWCKRHSIRAKRARDLKVESAK